MRESKRHTRLLSERSQNAVERVLRDLAGRICLAAPQLKDFDALAWEGAYRRLDSLLAATERILSVLPAENEDRRFESRYRGYLAEELDELRLFGIDVPEECERYPLSVAYVHLHAEASGAGRPEPVAEVLGPMKRVMIRGVAGSGKTTLLQWVAVRAATNDLPPEMAGWGAPVPFFLKLRSFVRRQEGKLSLALPNPADWVRSSTDDQYPEPPDGWVDRLLGGGRALLLIDGVDEVPSELWGDVRDWIRRLCRNSLAGRCRIVVSARLQLAEDWLSGNELGFESRTLAPFSLHDAEVLIRKWYEAIAPAMRAGRERDELPAEAAALIGEVTVIAPLRRLVDTPLIGAMICAVYRKDRSLPRSRADLYERTTKALILRRDRSRAIPRPDALTRIEESTLEVVLEELAFWMLLNSEFEPTLTEIDKTLGEALRGMGDPPKELTTEALRSYLIDRVALVRQPEHDRLSFVHKSFMEYFAAKAVHRHGHWKLLQQRVDDPAWEEVLCVAAALVGGESARALVIGVLGTTGIATVVLSRAQKQRRVLLALGCIDACKNLDPETRKRVQKAAAALIPPKNLVTARALAGLGSLVAPYLKPQPSWTPTECVLAIRAVTGIGGDEALELLGQYAEMFGDSVLEALDQARPEFTQAPFLEKVLSRVHSDAGVWRPQQLGGLEGVGSLTWLRELDLTNSPHVTDFRPLSECDRLVRLRINLEVCLQGNPLQQFLRDLRRPAGAVKTARNGMRLVWVPPGALPLDEQEHGAALRRKRVLIPRGFWLGESPITVGQYREFLPVTARDTLGQFRGRLDDELPMTDVTWDDAVAYSNWFGGRLPTEWEWEYAARGPEGRTYPWGEAEPNERLAVFGRRDGAQPVGSCPEGPSWCGGLDLAGNVWEWCSDTYSDTPFDSRTEVSVDPTNTSKNNHRVVRGGSWDGNPDNLRAAYRGSYTPTNRHYYIGFRLVLPEDP